MTEQQIDWFRQHVEDPFWDLAATVDTEAERKRGVMNIVGGVGANGAAGTR